MRVVVALTCLAFSACVAGDAVEVPVAKTTSETAVPAPPWTIQLADGSGNLWRFSRPRADGAATWSYVPVTPAESSSGVYSGGAPREGTLTDAQVQALWPLARAVDGDTAHHIEARRMGTHALSLGVGESRQTRLVDGGDALARFVAFLSSL